MIRANLRLVVVAVAKKRTRDALGPLPAGAAPTLSV